MKRILIVAIAMILYVFFPAFVWGGDNNAQISDDEYLTIIRSVKTKHDFDIATQALIGRRAQDWGVRVLGVQRDFWGNYHVAASLDDPGKFLEGGKYLVYVEATGELHKAIAQKHKECG